VWKGGAVSNHTPGPWRVNESTCVIAGPENAPFAVAQVYLGSEANAALIAAAPDLLEALETILGVDNKLTDDWTAADWRKAKAQYNEAAQLAIAKAKGWKSRLPWTKADSRTPDL
jgi:hypothetical protein